MGKVADATLISLLFLAAVVSNAQQKTATMSKEDGGNILNTMMLLGLATNTKDLTVDILSYIGSTSYGAISQTTAPVEKLIWEQHAETQKLYKMHAKEHVDKASKVVLDSYAGAAMVMGPMLEQVKSIAGQIFESFSMQANAMLDVAVERLEKKYPARKGDVPKDFLSRVLLLAHLTLVLYICFRVCMFALTTCLAVFCCVFCCGACRRRNGKGKAATKASTAKAAGKAAAQPAAKKAGKK